MVFETLRKSFQKCFQLGVKISIYLIFVCESGWIEFSILTEGARKSQPEPAQSEKTKHSITYSYNPWTIKNIMKTFIIT